METPVYDFVQEYLHRNGVRFHMPGHKGKAFLGCEPFDITEIAGADVLSEAAGILGESQKNASVLFHTGATFYSTEGSSQCIKAMLAAALMKWKAASDDAGGKPWVLAARNVHRAMIDGCALLDLEVEFLPFPLTDSICSVEVNPKTVEKMLERSVLPPVGVYLTSPDYLGVQCDIAEIARVCHRHQVPLLVDNAHGAYLAFLEPSGHPIALGADMCCDSAHKTLPVLTGGAYLHVSKACRESFAPCIPKALTLFGSTSPSYLTLQSLDLCNRYLAEDYRERLAGCIRKIGQIKRQMEKKHLVIKKGEPLKIVLDTAASGYHGSEIAQELREFMCSQDTAGIECEYADDHFLVLMLTPENEERDFAHLREWLEITRLHQTKAPLASPPGVVKAGRRRLSIREAVLSPSEMIPVSMAQGRILAQETVSCPPAVPIGISGEEVTEEMVALFQAYGIEEIAVCR